MTTAELNRDIKRLVKLEQNVSAKYDTKEYDQAVNELKKEYVRLYYADDKFEYMNVQSIKIMLRMNLRYRFVALHTFGLFIEY